VIGDVTRAMGGSSRLLLVLGLFGGLAGCGDPMLPSDFAGPPASAVGGNVSGAEKDATRPRLSLEWLSAPATQASGTALMGQPLSYRRSTKLENDWEIGVQLPSEQAKLTWGVLGSSPVRLAVGKMAYFDDRDGNGRLDWSCVGAGCDLVKAVSAEFVVYLDTPLYCQPRAGGPLRPRVAAGYHYYQLDGGAPRDLGGRANMSFVVSDRSLSESDPTEELRSFVSLLRAAWAGLGDGC
jgi:hypothetical protein